MNNIKCSVCYHLIKANEPIYGDQGNFFCKDCYSKPLNRNELFSNNKKDFYKQRKSWNEKAKESNAKILNSCDYTNYKK